MEMYESRCDVENDHWSEEREEEDEVMQVEVENKGKWVGSGHHGDNGMSWLNYKTSLYISSCCF